MTIFFLHMFFYLNWRCLCLTYSFNSSEILWVLIRWNLRSKFSYLLCCTDLLFEGWKNLLYLQLWLQTDVLMTLHCQKWPVLYLQLKSQSSRQKMRRENNVPFLWILKPPTICIHRMHICPCSGSISFYLLWGFCNDLSRSLALETDPEAGPWERAYDVDTVVVKRILL